MEAPTPKAKSRRAQTKYMLGAFKASTNSSEFLCNMESARYLSTHPLAFLLPCPVSNNFPATFFEMLFLTRERPVFHATIKHGIEL